MVSEASSEEASLSDVFSYVTAGDRFVQLTSALFCQMRELYNRGLHPPQSKANQFLGSGSQPIIAATDQLFCLTLFTQFPGSPRRLSQTKPPS